VVPSLNHKILEQPDLAAEETKALSAMAGSFAGETAAAAAGVSVLLHAARKMAAIKKVRNIFILYGFFN
jgi:hypothetical protein